MPSGPKNNKYYNRHAAEAQARDSERAEASKAAREKAREDAAWAETDAKAAKKQERDREAAQKAAEKERRAAEKKEQLEQEERESNRGPPKKVTQRQLQKDLSKMLADYDKQQQAMRRDTAEPAPLPEGGNPNHAPPDSSVEVVNASGRVGDVLSALESNKAGAAAGGVAGQAEIPDDRHIGKRAKVAYKAFYEEQLPGVKEERPGLRRTQYNDIIWDMWLKSPRNPFVQRSEKRDAERLAAERRWMEGEDDDSDDPNSNETGEDK